MVQLEFWKHVLAELFVPLSITYAHSNRINIGLSGITDTVWDNALQTSCYNLDGNHLLVYFFFSTSDVIIECYESHPKTMDDITITTRKIMLADPDALEKIKTAIIMKTPEN